MFFSRRVFSPQPSSLCAAFLARNAQFRSATSQNVVFSSHPPAMFFFFFYFSVLSCYKQMASTEEGGDNGGKGDPPRAVLGRHVHGRVRATTRRLPCPEQARVLKKVFFTPVFMQHRLLLGCFELAAATEWTFCTWRTRIVDRCPPVRPLQLTLEVSAPVRGCILHPELFHGTSCKSRVGRRPADPSHTCSV